MLQIILFGTQGCHLCEDAEYIVDKFLGSAVNPIALEHIDIAEQEQWQDQYAIRIPVLYHAKSGTELGWPFDEADVQKFLIQVGHAHNKIFGIRST